MVLPQGSWRVAEGTTSVAWHQHGNRITARVTRGDILDGDPPHVRVYRPVQGPQLVLAALNPQDPRYQHQEASQAHLRRALAGAACPGDPHLGSNSQDQDLHRHITPRARNERPLDEALATAARSRSQQSLQHQNRIQELARLNARMLTQGLDTLLPGNIRHRLRIRGGAQSRPARDIPGDFIDICEGPDNRIWAYLGDAAGSSLAPAFMGLIASTAIRQAIDNGIKTPARVLEYAAESVHDRIGGIHYATATVMAFRRLPGKGGRIEASWAVAGHEYPITVNPPKVTTPPPEMVIPNQRKPNGIALGMTDGANTHPVSGTRILHKGGTILIATDGITDHLSPEELTQITHRYRHRTPDYLSQKVLNQVETILSENPRADPDDRTILVIRNLG